MATVPVTINMSESDRDLMRRAAEKENRSLSNAGVIACQEWANKILNKRDED